MVQMARQFHGWSVGNEWNGGEYSREFREGWGPRDPLFLPPRAQPDFLSSNIPFYPAMDDDIQRRAQDCPTLPQIESLGMTGDEIAEVFPIKKEVVEAIFANKNVYFIGDSVIRTQYKDFIYMLNRSDLSPQSMLKRINEACCMGDVQADVSSSAFNGPLTSGARVYCTDDHLVHYIFTSRCLNSTMEKLICSFLEDPPDVIIMNSCVWDVSVYGIAKDGGPVAANGSCGYRELEDERSALVQYAVRLTKLMRALREVLPATTMFIWVTTPPVRPSRSTSVTQFNRNRHTGRLVHYGNYLASQIVRAAGYDIIDVDYFLRHPVFNFLQVKDGVHWLPEVVRLINQMLVYHIATSWEFQFDYATKERIKRIIGKSSTNRGFKRPSLFTDPDVERLLCPTGRPFYADVQDSFFEELQTCPEWVNFKKELGLLRCALFLQKTFPLDNTGCREHNHTLRACVSEPDLSRACYQSEEIHFLFHQLEEIIPPKSERPETATPRGLKRCHSETRLQPAKRYAFGEEESDI